VEAIGIIIGGIVSTITLIVIVSGLLGIGFISIFGKYPKKDSNRI
jgi:hypothetical protein